MGEELFRVDVTTIPSMVVVVVVEKVAAVTAMVVSGT
jgi:hypothetical protein